MKLTLLIAALLAVILAWLCPGTARAQPWIPAAGQGTAKPMVRLFSGDTSFPSSGFTTRAVASSKQSSTQLRLTGIAGLGHGLALTYDLRWGNVRTSKRARSVSSSGLQDEEFGLGYGLTQTDFFANAIVFNVVLPAGQTKPAPAQGTGRWAVEPDFEVGVQNSRFSASLQAGPRVFLDGNAVQLRTELDLAARATPRLTLTGSVFFVDTPQIAHTLPPGASGEIYNLLRLGMGVEYQLTQRFRPFFSYEANVAGKSIHAGSRFDVGIKVKY
ncbi:MAG: hypothetical protein POG74_07735 [Acidocella sp.]|nr:hypothetical protein [Acidocella sp.]